MEKIEEQGGVMRKMRIIITMVLCAIVFAQPALAFTASYKQVITANGKVVMEADFWMKDERMRMESAPGGQKMIMITREDGVYNYMPAQNTVMKMPVDSPMGAQKPNYVKDPDDYMVFLKNVGAQMVGSEVIDGNPCDIYEYKDLQSGMNSDVKVWVWKQEKFPLKMYIKSSYGESEVLFKEVRLNVPIEDSMFEVPKNAKMTDLSNMGQGF